jgi:NitT/TauT family transport system ATP-binding protein
MSPEAETVLHINNITKTFSKPGGGLSTVFENISLTVGPHEIVGILGRSGSGKSTLLRIIAGLIKPNAGEVMYRGQSIKGPVDGIAMVFQTFALFPWMTVLENVEVGLEARNISPGELRSRSLRAIDLIGLDGFEAAYPKELSGGMRQRVGFARALVVNPDLLLMDEPFSELDVLTAETLRLDFLDLWIAGKMSPRAAVLVTHNIEEAILLCDRVLVISGKPARITSSIPVTLSHPRDRLSREFRSLVDQIYSIMTAKPKIVQGNGKLSVAAFTERLPPVSTNQMSGLLEALASTGVEGKADLPHLAASLHLKTEELLRVAESLDLLGFAEIRDGDLHLSAAGKSFVDADILARKKIFAEHLIRAVPLASHIRRTLDNESGHTANRERFLQYLSRDLTTEESEIVLNIVIGWGRYAELYSYNERTDTFNLENP